MPGSSGILCRFGPFVTLEGIVSLDGHECLVPSGPLQRFSPPGVLEWTVPLGFLGGLFCVHLKFQNPLDFPVEVSLLTFWNWQDLLTSWRGLSLGTFCGAKRQLHTISSSTTYCLSFSHQPRGTALLPSTISVRSLHCQQLEAAFRSYSKGTQIEKKKYL